MKLSQIHEHRTPALDKFGARRPRVGVAAAVQRQTGYILITSHIVIQKFG